MLPCYLDAETTIGKKLTKEKREKGKNYTKMIRDIRPIPLRKMIHGPEQYLHSLRESYY